MKYRNTKTGVVIETVCVLSGKDWEKLETASPSILSDTVENAESAPVEEKTVENVETAPVEKGVVIAPKTTKRKKVK